MAGVSFQPALDYNEFLKRNEDALLIRVIYGGHTSTSSVPNHGVLLYFYRTPAMAEPVLVGDNLKIGALTVIDGNHRLMAHYLTFKSLQEVPAYVCIHSNMSKWPFIPSLARHSQ